MKKLYLTAIFSILFSILPQRLAAETTYTLKTPTPEIVNLGSMIEGVSSGGNKPFWKDSSGNTHLLAGFGGFPNSTWSAEYVNFATGAHKLISGQRGTVWRVDYNPAYNKVYIGTNYQGSLSEFDPVTQTLKVISNTIGPITSGSIGDDNRYYYLDYGDGPQSHVYSYDPSVGLPNGWKNYGPIPQSAGVSYGSVGADTEWLYVAVRKADGTYTLLMTRTSGTPSWTEWEFGSAGDTSISLGKEAGTLKWFAYRVLADGTSQTYYLENGSYANAGSITQASFLGPPHYIYDYDGGSDFGRIASYFQSSVDFTDLAPIRGTHEYSTVRYKSTTSTEWNEVTDSYPGPWTSMKTVCAIPQPGNSFFTLADAYTTAQNISYSPKSTTYLGNEVLSPYTAKVDPFTGEYYLGGYSNNVLRYDPAKPWTLNNTNATKRLPSDATKPNPYSIQMPSPGYHYRHSIDFGANGLVWIGGNTTRGTVTSPDHGNVMWYNPVDGSAGYIFPEWQSLTTPVLFRNLVAAANRTKIVVSSTGGQLYVIDANSKTVDGTYDLGEYAFMADVDGVVVGVSPAGNIFRFDPISRTMLTPPQNIGVAGYPFGVGNNQYSRMFFKLEKGPDNHLWMFVGNSLYRIDPTTLVFTKVIDTPFAAISFASNKTDLLLYGMYGTGNDVRYIPGILVPSETNSPSDLNSDSKVDATDLDILKNDFLKLAASLANPKSDINADGQATIRDIGIMMSQWRP